MTLGSTLIDKEELSFSRTLLLKAANESNLDGENMMLSIVDLFISRLTVAKLLSHMYIKQELSNRGINKILEHYERLFFQDHFLTKSTLRKIILILCDIEQYRTALRMLLSYYKYQTKNVVNEEDVEVYSERESEIIDDYTVESMVSGIMEHDIELFSKMPPKEFTPRQTKKPNNKFKMAAAVSDKMSYLVQFTLLWPNRDKYRSYIYQYWLLIARKLKEQGDLFGASAIASALLHSDVSRVIEKKEVVKELDFIEPNKNYYSYRNLEKELLNNDFFIPNLAVTAHDLTVILENFSLINIDFLFNKRKELLKTFNTMNKYKIDSNKKIKNLLKNLPDPSEEYIYALSRASIYKTGIKKSLDIKGVKNWNALDIEQWISQSLIPEDDKKEFFSFLVKEMKIIDGKGLLNILPEWPNKMMSFFGSFGRKNNDRVIQNYINLNALIYEIMEKNHGDELILSNEDIDNINKKNHSINCIELAYKTMFTQPSSKKIHSYSLVRKKSAKNNKSSLKSVSARKE